MGSGQVKGRAYAPGPEDGSAFTGSPEVTSAVHFCARWESILEWDSINTPASRKGLAMLLQMDRDQRCDPWLWRPLHYVALYGFSKAVEALVAAGAVIDARTGGHAFVGKRLTQDTFNFCSELECIIRGRPIHVRAEEVKGEELTIMKADNPAVKWNTTLDRCTCVEYAPVSPPPHLRHFSFVTPLHIAIEYQHIGAIRALLKHRADPNIGWNAGKNMPLHTAIWQGHYKAVSELLKAHADPNARDCWCRTPMATAAICPKTPPSVIAVMLMESGAKRANTDNCGKTAAQLARDCGNIEFADAVETYVLGSWKEAGAELLDATASTGSPRSQVSAFSARQPSRAGEQLQPQLSQSLPNEQPQLAYEQFQGAQSLPSEQPQLAYEQFPGARRLSLESTQQTVPEASAWEASPNLQWEAQQLAPTFPEAFAKISYHPPKVETLVMPGQGSSWDIFAADDAAEEVAQEPILMDTPAVSDAATPFAGEDFHAGQVHPGGGEFALGRAPSRSGAGSYVSQGRPGSSELHGGRGFSRSGELHADHGFSHSGTLRADQGFSHSGELHADHGLSHSGALGVDQGFSRSAGFNADQAFSCSNTLQVDQGFSRSGEGLHVGHGPLSSREDMRGQEGEAAALEGEEGEEDGAEDGEEEDAEESEEEEVLEGDEEVEVEGQEATGDGQGQLDGGEGSSAVSETDSALGDMPTSAGWRARDISSFGQTIT